ncbi:putative late blight resistance protein homolog R1A-3 [Henckelia pumila]|uniref:putative late blight resistance protein homolog R1A-3 n=1 Tax=Henckelia pumila TaxID=405737 RepID=UPI003C6E9FFD
MVFAVVAEYDDKSWTLFHDKVFGKGCCPPELEEVGKTIVRNCRGLPLAIVAISGLLAKSSRTVEYWKYVADNTNAALNMGEDRKIRISKLVQLWMAEGILKPMRYRSLEEIGEDNLKDLTDSEYEPIKLPVCFKLLSVLCIDGTYSHEEILRLVNMRCIHFETRLFRHLLNNLESLTLLWNLQTVTLAGTWSITPVNLPTEIWEMPQLRHLKKEDGDFYLPDPPSTNGKNGRGDIIVLKNRQTLYMIRNFRCTDEIVRRIPNLKKLGITRRRFSSGIGWEYYDNLAHLSNLESLYLDSVHNVPQNLCFPRSFKKLTLQNCQVPWEDLTSKGVNGILWKEGHFLELKSLRIEHSHVAEWIADSSHFPSLEKLELVNLTDLEEIPLGIGEIPTLGTISLTYCCDSANSSAEKIQEEQQSLGNYDLQLRIRGGARGFL